MNLAVIDMEKAALLNWLILMRMGYVGVMGTQAPNPARSQEVHLVGLSSLKLRSIWGGSAGLGTVIK